MNVKRTLYALTAAIWLMMMASPATRAASEAAILQWRLNPNANELTLYVRHADGAAVRGVRIGGEEIEDAEIARDASETALVTWILFDNSASMPEGVRAKASELLTTLLGERGRGETYNFCTFSDRLSVKLRDSNSFADLKKRIDDMEYRDQRSSPIGAAGEVLREESARTGPEFVRIVIISTGGDSVPTEKDLENLRESLASGNLISNIPIYVIGCGDGANGDSLSQLYALSAQTYARCWDINEIGASDIAKIMRWEEIPVKVTLKIPENLSAGSAQEIEVTFSDGSFARSAVIAEDVGGRTGDGAGDIDSAAPDNAGGAVANDGSGIANTEQDNGKSEMSDAVSNGGSDIANTEQDNGESGMSDAGQNDKDGFSIGVIALSLCLAVAGAGAFLIFRRKTIFVNAVPAFLSGVCGGKQRVSNGGGNRNPNHNATANVFDANGGARFPTLFLTDTDHPERQFSASLQSRVTIGRSPDNVISLNYDQSISRRHCEAYLRNNQLWIQDCNSSGGTYLDNNRMTNAKELSDGSIIRLGHVSYKVEIR